MLNRLKPHIKALLDGSSKWCFLKQIPKGSRVLDVGCGNHSATQFLNINSTIRYIGIDIEEYNIDANDYKAAEELIFVEPINFVDRIKKFGPYFDFVISSHNLEHTHSPIEVLEAMCSSVKNKGKLFLSFPCEASVKFPKRKGTLNFYDDTTHVYLPKFELICKTIECSGFKIITKIKRNRPMLLFILGALTEPISLWMGKVLPFTWAFWGFETILVAEKQDNISSS